MYHFFSCSLRLGIALIFSCCFSPNSIAQNCIEESIQGHSYVFPDYQTFCLSDFCDDIGNYIIDDIHSSFFCGISILDEYCIRYYPLPGFEQDDFLEIIVCDKEEPTNCESIHISLYVYPSGYSSPQSIGGTVWFDHDEDGIRDANEGGIAGVSLTLEQADGSIYTTRSMQNGYYEFLDIPTGNHQINVGEGPSNTVLTTPSQIMVELQTSEQYMEGDFGFSLPFDWNCVIDTFRARVPYLTPQTYCIEDFCKKATDLVIQEVQTTFLSANIYQDEHCFEYMPLPGFAGIDTSYVTICEADDSTDCQTVVILHYIHGYTYDEETNVLLPSWLETPQQTLTAIVCIDDLEVSPDSYPDFSLPNCPMVQIDTMEHLAEDCFLLTVNQTDIPAQECAIQLCQAAGIVCQDHTLIVGIPNEDHQAVISGTVFLDDNENGVREEEEVGIAGVLLDLSLPDGAIITIQTDEHGAYTFLDLPAATYTVSVNAAQNGQQLTAPSAEIIIILMDSEIEDSVDFGFVSVTKACFTDTLHVALEQHFSRNEYCLEDFCDALEGFKLADVQITLPNSSVGFSSDFCFSYLPANPIETGVTDTVEMIFCHSTIPNHCVSFVILGHSYEYDYLPDSNTLIPHWTLAPDNTLMMVICSDIYPFFSLSDCTDVTATPLGSSCTQLTVLQDAPIQTCPLTICRDETEADCEVINLYVEPMINHVGTISGVVWADQNSDGVQRQEEIGIADIEVTLLFPDGTIQRINTNEDGNYMFNNLPQQIYQVAVGKGPDHSLPTTATSISVDLTDERSFEGADFGLLLRDFGCFSDTIYTQLTEEEVDLAQLYCLQDWCTYPEDSPGAVTIENIEFSSYGSAILIQTCVSYVPSVTPITTDTLFITLYEVKQEESIYHTVVIVIQYPSTENTSCAIDTLHSWIKPVEMNQYCLEGFCTDLPHYTTNEYDLVTFFNSSLAVENNNCVTHRALPGFSGTDTITMLFCDADDEKECIDLFVLSHYYPHHYDNEQNLFQPFWWARDLGTTVETLICPDDLSFAGFDLGTLSIADCALIQQQRRLENGCLHLILTEEEGSVETCQMLACRAEATADCETISFEITKPAKAKQMISGSVWIDANQDGIMNIEEHRLAGIPIQLKSRLMYSAQTYSDEQGHYQFNQLPLWEYEVSVIINEEEYILTTPLSIDTSLQRGAGVQEINFGLVKVHEDAVGFSGATNAALNIQITPNPTNHQFTIQLAEYQPHLTYTLANIQGKMIQQQMPINGENNYIDVSELPNGVYLLSIYQKGIKIKTEKIMIVY